MGKCQSCGHSDLRVVVDLGKQPICNRFLDKKSDFKNEKRYPLKLVYCANCNLVQLSYILPTSVTFDKNFNYLTATNPEIVRYFNTIGDRLGKKFRLSRGDYVIDIGSNDGTALVPFKKKNISVLGVDPAPKPAAIANKKGIKTIVGSFENSIGMITKITDGKVKLITAYNVLAHTHDINEFLDDIKRILELNNDAVFISQSHYFGNLVDGCEFDTIYHEHARYYTVTSLKHMFARHGLYIYRVEKAKFYGGSILVYAGMRKPSSAEKTSINRWIKSEKKYTSEQAYAGFAKAVEKKRRMLRSILKEMKADGMRIIGIGAPMKSSTLLNYCNIDVNTLDYITEVNRLKIGTYSPGMHIPVIDERVIVKDKPDAALILSWNLSDPIVKSMRRKGYKGKFIVPLPLPRVIN